MKTAVRLSSILAEIEEFAASSDSAPVFFHQLLSDLSTALDARAAACWMRDQDQSVSLFSEHQFSTLDLQNDVQGTRLNQRILSDALAAVSKRGHSLTGRHNSRPKTASFDGADPASKSPVMNRSATIVPFQLRNDEAVSFVLLIPIFHKGNCVGVLEFFAGGERWLLDSEDHRDLNSVVTLVDQYLERLEESTRATDPSGFLEVFQGFSAELHSSLDPTTIAVSAVNDAVSILKCDRATLLLKHGSRWDVVAVSGHGPVNARSNQIQLLQKLTHRVAGIRDVLLYTGHDDKIPMPVADSLAAYVSESGSRMLLLRPLFHSVVRNRNEAQNESQHRKDGRLLGAIVLEQFTASRPAASLQKYAEPVCDQISLALSNALAYRRIPLLPLLDALGAQWNAIRGRTIAKVAVFLCCCAVLLAVLVKVPAEYMVDANGKLMPALQRRVFTEFDGEVREILVQPGQRVEIGTPLLTLSNDAFSDELRLLRSQRDESRKSLLGLNSELHSVAKTGAREHQLRLQAEIEQCRIDVSSLQNQISQVEKRIERLTLRAPITGTVVTFADQQQMIGRPVRRGDTLLEIMDESGPWRLELEIPENRMHHVRHGISVYGEEVPATFKLSADPANEFSGWLSHTSERSTISPETGSVVKVYVSLNDAPNLPKRIGADVRTRLECGEYSLLYVLFGDIVEFAEREFWL